MSLIRKATRTQQQLRLALCGVSGSGKSYTALRMGHALLEPGQRLLVLDSEHGSAELYAADANPDGGVFDFDVIRLDKLDGGFSPRNYLLALREGAKERYPVVVVDSLSHAWAGPGGVLDYVDTVAERKKGNKFSAWKEGTAEQNALVNALLSYPGHVIVTMRSKTDYVQEVDSKGRKTVRKVGLNPIQRDGIEYEFTVTADIDDSHRLVVSKTRCSALADRAFLRAGKDVVDILKAWMEQGEKPAPKARPATPEIDLVARAAEVAEVSTEDAAAFVSMMWPEWQSWGEDGRRRCAADMPGNVEQAMTDFRKWLHAGMPAEPTKKAHGGDADAWERAKAAWATDKRAMLRKLYGVDSAKELHVGHAAGRYGLAWCDPRKGGADRVADAWEAARAS